MGIFVRASDTQILPFVSLNCSSTCSTKVHGHNFGSNCSTFKIIFSVLSEEFPHAKIVKNRLIQKTISLRAKLRNFGHTKIRIQVLNYKSESMIYSFITFCYNAKKYIEF